MQKRFILHVGLGFKRRGLNPNQLDDALIDIHRGVFLWLHHGDSWAKKYPRNGTALAFAASSGPSRSEALSYSGWFCGGLVGYFTVVFEEAQWYLYAFVGEYRRNADLLSNSSACH